MTSKKREISENTYRQEFPESGRDLEKISHKKLYKMLDESGLYWDTKHQVWRKDIVQVRFFAYGENAHIGFQQLIKQWSDDYHIVRQGDVRDTTSSEGGKVQHFVIGFDPKFK